MRQRNNTSAAFFRTRIRKRYSLSSSWRDSHHRRLVNRTCLRIVCAALVCIVLLRTFAWAPQKTVTYSSECSCEGDSGVARWRAKTDPFAPPSNRHDIQSITPSEFLIGGARA